MENKQLARPFRQLAQLLELYEENPFKVKAVASAGLKIDKCPVNLWELSNAELEQQEGIGKSIAAKIVEFRQTGQLAELEQMKEKTPAGILDMLRIKGLGPKKTGIIWKQLEVDTLGDLYYACNENRLVEIKGFGTKTQEEIKKALEFTFRSQGKFIYALVEPIALDWQLRLAALPGVTRVEIGGSLRRKIEVVEDIELVVESNSVSSIEEFLLSLEGLNREEVLPARNFTAVLPETELIEFREESGIPIRIYIASESTFTPLLFLGTGSREHLEQLGPLPATYRSELDLYASLNLQFIEPELREGLGEIELARKLLLKPLVEFKDLKGSIHNHSTYSDGVHTLAEMASACIALGLEYLVISDHSQSAFYAHGLLPEQIISQHAEIDGLNKRLAPFHIFKGIESDILSDGSLDYPEAILQSFDVIIASVHSNLRMDIDKATTRLLRAIENPYTTILGHPTGRLLLGREGYPIDHKKVIDACAANGVVIEINANPNRLDLDWRWIGYALEKGVMLSINPDAHRKEGLLDMQFGTHVARKGGLSKEMCLNALDLASLRAWLKQRKSIKSQLQINR